jgi:hypothetical protein
MTQADQNPEPFDEEILPEYNFSQGVRGKHYRAYRQGHSVTIHHPDGTTTVQHFRPNPSLEEVDREPDR